MAEWRADARYTRLVVEHGATLLRLAVLLTGNRHDAEDVVQDVVIAAARSWPFAKPLPYLKRAVANRSVDTLRRRRDLLIADPPETPYEDAGFLRDEQHRAFFLLLSDLPERQRETLVLRYYADFSDRQIAETLSVSVQAVRNLTHRALATLRASEPAQNAKES